MAKRLHHIEIIPGKNGHTVRHFFAVTEGGRAAYQSESHVFGSAEDVANHVEDALEKHDEANEPKRSPKAEEREEASEAGVVGAGKARQRRRHDREDARRTEWWRRLRSGFQKKTP
jgi:hypothetical protein